MPTIEVNIHGNKTDKVNIGVIKSQEIEKKNETTIS